MFRRVRPTIAFEILRDNEDLMIVDLRVPGLYAGETGHLNGALNIPLDELPNRLDELPEVRDETFLVYCDGGPCDHRGMTLLTAAGFEQAVLIDGGITAWRANGFGTVDGPERSMPPADGDSP